MTQVFCFIWPKPFASFDPSLLFHLTQAFCFIWPKPSAAFDPSLLHQIRISGVNDPGSRSPRTLALLTSPVGLHSLQYQVIDTQLTVHADEDIQRNILCIFQVVIVKKIHIFFHPHITFWENVCRWCCLLKSGVEWETEWLTHTESLSVVCHTKPGNKFFQEKFFKYLLWTNFLLIFSHTHLGFCNCLLKSGVEWLNERLNDWHAL
jgi:hypothetical protein